MGAQSQELITELGANEYWTKDPQGIQAMVYYMYLRGALYICNGMNPKVMQEALLSFVPEKWHQEFSERLGLEVPWLIFRNEGIETEFYHCYPVFEFEKLNEKLGVLDKNI